MLQGLFLKATFLFSLVPVNSIKELPGVRKYEVVYPRRLHPLHKREVKESDKQEQYETELKYKMTVNGKILVIYLNKSKDLLAPGYTETLYNPTGKEVTTSPQIMEDCYYQGHIINENVSDASISTCRGLRGYFSQGDQRYFIEPLSATHRDEQGHALFKYEPYGKTNSSCGMDDMLWAHGFPQNVAPPATSLNKSEDQKAWEREKYIEYYLVLDNSVFKKYNQDTEEIRKRVFEMVNYINMLYKKLNTHVALVGMEIWNDKDKIEIIPKASFTLENFSYWKGGVLLRRKHHDVAQLLTATEFSGTTVGLAYMSTMCTPYHSVGIVQELLLYIKGYQVHLNRMKQYHDLQDHSENAIRVASIMAHEMGHNCGMSHDSEFCSCSSSECVMDRAMSFYIPTDFSSCSRAGYEKFLEDKLSNCLFNVPLPTAIISPPICGNQLVELGEECDCGTPEECTNICCDPETCKMKAKSQCALGECCEKCQFKQAGKVCRPAKDECDLTEMCDGQSGICPEDRFQVNGLPCQNGMGYCFMGLCPTLQGQCAELWGPGTKVADKSCYRTNEGGSAYGYCHKVNDTPIPCKAKDAMCGKLFCQGGSDSMFWKGKVVTFLACKAFDPEDSNQEIGMVAKGTKCGNMKVCINAECVDIERAYKATNCSSKCKGHSVCDHELQCQCKEGWAPPGCQESSAVFHFSIVVGVLFPVAIVLIVVAIVSRHQSTRGKQKKVQRPLSTTGIRPRKQKRVPPTVKAVQPQEMNQMNLPVSDLPAEGNEPPDSFLNTKPDFPPPPIPTFVSSSFLHQDTNTLPSTVFMDKPMSAPEGSNPNV